MPRNDPPPPPPPTCETCTSDQHDACLRTAYDDDGQVQPCSCPCGGGTEGAWL